MFAGKLATFVIEGVTDAVARWVSENGYPAVVLEPPHLDVVGNIAPDQIPADSVPRGTFRPQCSEMQSPDDGIADDVFLEAAVECDNIGIRILDGILAGEIAGWRLRVRRCGDRCSAESG